MSDGNNPIKSREEMWETVAGAVALSWQGNGIWCVSGGINFR